MGQGKGHEPGTFCWMELATPDSAGARRFYARLFGWESADLEGNAPGYVALKLRGQDIGALYELGEDQKKRDVRASWLSYVAVASADASARRAAELGGALLTPPFDVVDQGRLALISDPTGAELALWQAEKHPGAAVLGEPGAVCWNELLTDDVATCAHFYSELFGWRARVGSTGAAEVTVFSLAGGRPVASLLRLPEAIADTPPRWLAYVGVPDCAAAVAAAQAAGGSAPMPGMEVEGFGRFAVLIDPQGAELAVLEAPASR